MNRIYAQIMVALFGAAMVAWSVHKDWRINNRSDSDFAKQYADMVLDTLPEGAVLFVFGDFGTSSIGYYHHIEKRRPDVALYSIQGLLFRNRLYSRLSKEKREVILTQFVDSTKRAVFFTSDCNIRPHRKGLYYHRRHMGFLFEVVKDRKPGTIELTQHRRGEEYFTYLVQMQPIDSWECVERNARLFLYGQYLGLIYFSGDPGLLTSMQELFQLAQRSYTCLVGIADVLIKHGNSSHWEQVSAWLDKADTLKNQALQKKMLAKLYYLKGSLLQKQGNRASAVANFKRSWDIYPHPNNKALEGLETLQKHLTR